MIKFVDCVVVCGLCGGLWTVWWSVDCVVVCGRVVVCGLCGGLWISFLVLFFIILKIRIIIINYHIIYNRAQL